MFARFVLPALALLAAPALAFAQAPACPQLFAGGRSPALLNLKLEQRTTLLCNDAYAVLASGVTRGALWSAEHPTADSLEAARGTPREGQSSTSRSGCRQAIRRGLKITVDPASTGATWRLAATCRTRRASNRPSRSPTWCRRPRS